MPDVQVGGHRLKEVPSSGEGCNFDPREQAKLQNFFGRRKFHGTDGQRSPGWKSRGPGPDRVHSLYSGFDHRTRE